MIVESRALVECYEPSGDEQNDNKILAHTSKLEGNEVLSEDLAMDQVIASSRSKFVPVQKGPISKKL